MYLKAGERFTVEELLYGMMLVSGNDAATALACHVSGSIEDFAILMNCKANDLGCVNTHFENPHGLDSDNHYSCAYDLALIMSAAMKNEHFSKIVGEKNINIAGRRMQNHNKLLWNCEGCIGGKTGYTEAAGRTLVTCCRRNGMDLICVTISDRDDWNDHTRLYDWGFSEYMLVNITKNFDIPVISGVYDNVTAICDNIKILCKKDEEITIEYYLPDFVYAPVYQGQQLGSIKLNEDCEFKLIASNSVEMDNTVPLNFWEQIKWSWYYFNEHSGYIPFLPRY